MLGPVLGGFFADGPGWEWIFFINVPLGIVALVVTSAALKMPHVRRDHSIDYLGAAVIVASVSSILLYTAWAGPERGWGDTHRPDAADRRPAACRGVRAGRAAGDRADHPDAALRATRSSPSRTRFGFLIGIAMFGSMIYLPVYLQVVSEMSPTRSGLAMLPMIVGLFSTSLTAGQIMSRTGRYRFFPPTGAALIVMALLLLSRLDADSPYWFAGLSMYLFGAGLGLCLQVIVVVVQNAVDRSDIGVATSSIAFFRQMGGSFGTALFGAILTSRLSTHLAEVLPGGASAAGQVDTNDTDAIRAAAAGRSADWCRRRSAARSTRCS